MQTGIGIDKQAVGRAKLCGRLAPLPLRAAAICVFVSLFISVSFSQSKYDGRPIGNVNINFGEADNNLPLVEQYRLIARENIGTAYSPARIRDAIGSIPLPSRRP